MRLVKPRKSSVLHALMQEAIEDTTGAGDAFIGSMLYGITKGMSHGQMLRLAAVVAACKCTALGARPGLPHADSISPELLSAKQHAVLEELWDVAVVVHLSCCKFLLWVKQTYTECYFSMAFPSWCCWADCVRWYTSQCCIVKCLHCWEPEVWLATKC